MTLQCLQQCHQCHHSAYSSAIKEWLFLQVSSLQCHQCHQFPITLLRTHAYAHVGAELCRRLMALMALAARHLRVHRFPMALFVGTALALVMALPTANRSNPDAAS